MQISHTSEMNIGSELCNLYSTQQNDFPYGFLLGGKLSLATWLNRGERRFIKLNENEL